MVCVMANINDSLAVKPKSKRIFYFDALRAMAIIAVIVIHVFSETMVLFKYGQLPFHSGGQQLMQANRGIALQYQIQDIRQILSDPYNLLH